MKRTRAQQPKAQEQQLQDPAAADASNPKPQRRAKQPRQPKSAKKPAAAARAAVVAAVDGAAANAAASFGADTAPTVPDVCSAGEAGAAGHHAVDWDLDAGLLSDGAWWTWGVDEEKLLGWFPFVEDDFRCLHGGVAAAEVAFDDDIWRIHQIYEIPNYAAK